MSKEIRDNRDPVAERIVVGAILTDDTGEEYAVFRKRCTVDMLTEPPLRWMMEQYEAAIVARGAACHRDVLEAVNRLADKGADNKAMWDEFWNVSRHFGPGAPIYIDTYCDRIADLAAERKGMEQLASALFRAKNAPTSVERAVAMEEAKQIRIASNQVGKPNKNQRLGLMLQNIMRGKAIRVLIPSAVSTITRMLGGGYLESGLYVWAGPPKFGKTSFAIGELLAASKATRKRGLFISMEMPEEQLDNRFVSYISGLPEKRIEAGLPEDMPAIIQAMSDLSEIPYDINTMVGHKISAIVRYITDEHERNPLGFIVVDFLQRIPRGDKTLRSDEEIGAQCKALCAVSILVRAPVLLLSQLNREYSGRSGRRFKMTDLRGSGEIEADADMIGFIWRDVYGEFGLPQSYTEVDIVAHRHFPPDYHQIFFDGATFRFKSSDDEEPMQNSNNGGKR